MCVWQSVRLRDATYGAPPSILSPEFVTKMFIPKHPAAGVESCLPVRQEPLPLPAVVPAFCPLLQFESIDCGPPTLRQTAACSACVTVDDLPSPEEGLDCHWPKAVSKRLGV